jgi:hypothetical protein
VYIYIFLQFNFDFDILPKIHEKQMESFYLGSFERALLVGMFSGTLVFMVQHIKKCGKLRTWIAVLLVCLSVLLGLCFLWLYRG